VIPHTLQTTYGRLQSTRVPSVSRLKPGLAVSTGHPSQQARKPLPKGNRASSTTKPNPKRRQRTVSKPVSQSRQGIPLSRPESPFLKGTMRPQPQEADPNPVTPSRDTGTPTGHDRPSTGFPPSPGKPTSSDEIGSLDVPLPSNPISLPF